MSLPQRRNRLLEVSKSRSPVDSGNAAIRQRQAAPKMVPLPPRYERSWKPMTLRPQPRPDLLRPLSRQLGLSCMTRTFLKSMKSVPESSVFKKERPPRRISTLSPDFRLRWAVDETRPPTVIGEYWIDHLDRKGRLAKCKPNAFKYEDEWLPLYTRDGVTKQVSGLGPLLNTQGDSHHTPRYAVPI